MAATPAPLPLVSRDAELAQLRALVAATAAGTGGCAVVTGPPGIGKTRLLDVAVADAAARGIATAAGQAKELDRVAPLATLMGTLRRCAPDTLDLEALRGQDGDRYWLIDRIGELLEVYVAKQPLLIAIDDAQWADEFSVLALRVLVPALSSSPLRWVFARRPVPAPSPAQDTLDWLVSDGAEEIRPGLLDEAAVAQLCANVLGAAPDHTVLVHATQDPGNPFLLEQWLRAMSQAGQILVADGVATVTGAELPQGFLSAVDLRLRALSEPARRQLLPAGSVFGRPFTLHTAAAVAGARATDLVSAAAEAVAAGVLVEDDTCFTFAHDLLRQAVYNQMPAPVRATLHREAAGVLRGEGCSAVEIAEHLSRSGVSGDREAVEVLRAAAGEIADHAPGTAANLLLRALGMLTPEDRQAPMISADAVGLLASAGRLAEARELGEAALASRLDPASEATVLLGLAESLKHAGHNQEAVDYARRGLAVPDLPDTIRPGLYAIQAHALLYVDDLAGADQAGAEADRLGAVTGEHQASVFGAAARSVVARAEGRLDDAVRHAEHAVEIADRVGGDARHRHPRIWLGGALAAVDRLDEAEQAYAVGRREATRLGTAWSQPLWHFYSASTLTGLGRLDEAVAEAEAGVRIADQLTARQLGVPLLGLLTRIAILRGQMPLARENLRRMNRLIADGVTAAPEDVRWPVASFQEAEGRPGPAAESLSYFYDELPDRMLLLSNDPTATPAMVRVALAAGRPDDARASAAAARYLAGRNPGVASLAGAAAHAEGLLHNDLDALREAVRHYRGSPRRLARAGAFEDAGLAERGAGTRAAAVELLEAALDEYTRCGAQRGVARLEAHLRRSGTRRRSTPAAPTGTGALRGLTAAELRVARLVAQGLTNRDVAEQLFLSPHTVDTHLRHIFEKLGVKGRVEMTVIVVGDDNDDDI